MAWQLDILSEPLEFIIGLERVMEDVLCEVCQKKPSVMTTDYSAGRGEGTEWKSICFSCFNKQFEKNKQKDKIKKR